jgi:hypothetical protein
MIISLFLTMVSGIATAQDISSLSMKGSPSLSGNLRLGGFYYTHDKESNPRLPPLGYQISGGLNASWGAIQIPISFVLSQHSLNVSNPFNMYGASPYYKWIKLHLGHRSLDFSPYVFSGRTFQGVGIELTPGKWQVVGFTGRLRNLLAFREEVATGAIVLPHFDRRIEGAKLGFGSRNNRFELMAIRVRDQEDQVNNFMFPPAENLVIGTRFQLRFFKRLQLQVNSSASLFTSNTTETRPREVSDVINQLSSIHPLTLGTRASLAGDAALNYNHKGYLIGLRYRRIEPFYQSLATNFIQNDVENITVQAAVPLLNKKLRIRGEVGRQRDNLQNHKAFTSNRWISAVTGTWLPGPNFNLMFRYSNYQHESTTGVIEVIDTLRILTTTHNAMLNTQWKVYEKEGRSVSLSLNIFSNELVDEALLAERNNSFSGRGISSRVTYLVKEWDASGGPIFNYNSYTYTGFSQGRKGGGFFISKGFWEKKINTTLVFNRQQNLLDKKANGRLLNMNFQARYRINRTHQISLGIIYLENQTIITNSFKETRGNISYGLQF